MQSQPQADLEEYSNSSGAPQDTFHQEPHPDEDYHGVELEGFEDLCDFVDREAGFTALVHYVKATSPGKVVRSSQRTLQEATQ